MNFFPLLGLDFLDALGASGVGFGSFAFLETLEGSTLSESSPEESLPENSGAILKLTLEFKKLDNKNKVRRKDFLA